MAASTLSAPGTEFGPCETDCHHRDCAATRIAAQGACQICGEPIGYDRRYYIASDGLPGRGPWEHADCVEAAL